MSLNKRQSRFVEEYLVDLNATQAAIRAGYSKRTAYQQGHRLLKHVEVEAQIHKAQEARSERTEITQDMVLQELARIGFADIRELFEWDDERTVFVPSKDLTSEQAAAISEVQSETTRYTREDGETETKIRLKLKTYDKLGALRDIGRHLGMFTDKVEHSGQVNTGVLRVAGGLDPDAWEKVASGAQAELGERSAAVANRISQPSGNGNGRKNGKSNGNGRGA